MFHRDGLAHTAQKRRRPGLNGVVFRRQGWTVRHTEVTKNVSLGALRIVHLGPHQALRQAFETDFYAAEGCCRKSVTSGAWSWE
jgi:hypothetical protein